MLTQRLGSKTEKDMKFIDSFIEAVRENPGSCDEVWLASEYGYPKIEVHKNTGNLLTEVAEKFRNEGIRVSLQISNTIGHGQYMSSLDCSGLVYENSPIQNLIASDGTSSNYCFCWNDKNFRDYIKQMLVSYAHLNPYCVWFDDDLRAVNHSPADRGCFCDSCMKKFNSKYNCNFTREELVHEINYGNIDWRKKFVEFLREDLYDFTYFMAKIMNEISPDSFMGLQNYCNGGYTGFGLKHLYDALYKASGKPPKSRPGGGAYSGHNPIEFLKKAYGINWQNIMLPDYVSEIRPEIENLPDVVFGKAIASTCFETTLYLANGNTSMSYAMIMNDYDSMDWHKEEFHAFSKHRPYWKRLIKSNENTYPSGMKISYSHSMWEKAIHENDKIFSWEKEPFMSGFDLWSCNAIPICYSKKDDGVFLLHPDFLERMTDDDILALLKKPVLTDGKCIEILHQRGFGDYVSAKAVPIDATTLHEKFTEHKVNEKIRGCREWITSFVGGAYHYEILDKNGETETFGVYRSNIEGVSTDSSDIIANAVVKTTHGAKWAVFGHYLWNSIISLNKRNQIIYATNYISDHAIPVILESPTQAVLLPRENEKGEITSVSVVNTSIGNSGTLTLRIHKPAGTKITFMSQTSKESTLSYEKENDYYIVKMPSIDAWSVGTVFFQKYKLSQCHIKYHH